MSLFEWKDDYAVGDSGVDSQHRQLLELAQLLYNAARDDKADSVVRQAIDALIVYTERHFADEEECLAGRGSPLLDDQRHEHIQLTTELRALCSAYAAVGEGFGATLERWVSTRLVPHMLTTDRCAFEAKPPSATESAA